MILISNDFWYKIKMYNFDPYNVLLSIATNMPQTGFVLQGHIYENYISPIIFWCEHYVERLISVTDVN